MGYISQILLILSLGVAGVPRSDGTVQEQLEAINRAYAQIPRLQTDVTYNLYPNWDAEVPVDVLVGKVKRQGTKLLIQYPTYEMLETESVSIHVDHDEKIVVISSKQPDTRGLNWISEDISASLRSAATTRAAKVSETSVELSFTFNSGSLTSATVRYDPATSFLQSIALNYNESHYLADSQTMPRPRMEIILGKHDVTSAIAAADFSTSKYFLPGSGWTLNKTYSDYELVNLLD